MTTNERIDELKNALQGALLVPSECAFVSTEIIKICIETLEKSKGDKWYQHGRTDGRADAIEEFAHALKETFNNEFPSNYHCTRPYFTLDNVRVLVDSVANEQK